MIVRQSDAGLNTEKTLLESFLQYVSIVLKYRWLVLGTTALVGLGVIAFCVASVMLPPDKSPLPNQYTASSIILVHGGTENDLATVIRAAVGMVGGPADSGTGYDNGAFLLMVLQSRTFLDKIVDEFDIAKKYKVSGRLKSQLRRLLVARLRLDYSRTTGAITISYRDTDPVFARDITNRFVSYLSEWYSQNLGSSNMQQRQLLEEKLSAVKADIDTLESRLSELQNRYGVMTAQDLGTSQASSLAAARSQLILKDIDIKNYSKIGGENDPKLLQLQQERQNILTLISRLQQGMPETTDTSASPQNVPDVQTEFNNLTVQLDVQRKIYNTLSHQSEVLKLTSDSGPPFQVMELAEVPDAKSGPARVRIVEEGILIALVASILLAFLLNGISRVRSIPARKVLTRKGG